MGGIRTSGLVFFFCLFLAAAQIAAQRLFQALLLEFGLFPDVLLVRRKAVSGVGFFARFRGGGRQRTGGIICLFHGLTDLYAKLKTCGSIAGCRAMAKS
jgi:hypothetical protein